MFSGQGFGSPAASAAGGDGGISYSGRTYAEGKKIHWRDGVQAVRCIIKYGLQTRGARPGNLWG